MGGGETQSTFIAFYEQHFRAVFSYSFVCVADNETAEDLTAKTFEKALRSWPPHASDPCAQKAWLFTIARHVVYDYYREAKQRWTLSLDQTPIDGQLTLSEEEAIIERLDLQAALATLSERDQTLVAMECRHLVVPDCRQLECALARIED